MGLVWVLVVRLASAVVIAVMVGDCPYSHFCCMFAACFMHLEMVKSSLLVIRAGFQLQNPMCGHYMRCAMGRVRACMAMWGDTVVGCCVRAPRFTALWVFCDPANGRILLVDVSLSVPVCKYVEEA